MKGFSKSTLLFSILCSLLIFSSCGSKVDKYLSDSPERSGRALFEAGNQALLEQEYDDSIEFYTALKENYPFSPYAIEAELYLADAYFLNEDWLLAAESYREFEMLHPRHPSIPYVLYQTGLSYLNSYDSIDRPPTQVHEAYSYFNRLIESFPGDDYEEHALQRIFECRRLIAENELYVGDLFFKNDKYGAAWLRYKKIVDDYSDTGNLYEYAHQKLHGTYLLYLNKKTELTRREREGSWHNWLKWL